MSDWVEITLTWFELGLAASVGVRRRVISMRDPASKERFPGADGWTRDIEGAAGEMACARALGRYWNGSVCTFTEGGDIGRGLEVRTRTRHDWDLIVRPDAHDEDRYVLVTGIAPVFRVHGFILARDAKRDEWLADHGRHGPAYFVPRRALRPLAELLHATPGAESASEVATNSA